MLVQTIASTLRRYDGFLPSHLPDLTLGSSTVITPPASNWVRFLRNYGPLPTNGNLFDEYVYAARLQANVQPIELPTPHVDEMVQFIQEGDCGSLLIAGTAGDGKTYHARQLWLRLGGEESGWSPKSKVKTLKLPDGRTVTFVKDLSELKGTEGDLILEGLESSVLGENQFSVYVIACNHGQILDRLRKHLTSDGAPSPLLHPVQNAFLQSGYEFPRLKVFDLSRSAAHRQSLAGVIKAITEHPEWERCKGCELNEGGRVCPIAENRKRALGKDDNGRFSKRLGDLIEIARLNGAHLPVRDLLALVTNMLLGHVDAKERLLTCAEVAQVQDSQNLDQGSIYRNVFGANLDERRAMARPVFRTMASLGIGTETTNSVDGLLVYGSDDSKLEEDFDRLVGSDPIYGATEIYRALQRQYLEGSETARLENGADNFLARLRDQRQRLYFTLPDDAADKYPFWELTTFRFAGEYLELLASVAPGEGRRIIDDRIRARIVRGLNRVMTGLLLDNPETIFVASSGGFTQSKISVLCETPVPSRRSAGASAGMQIRWNRDTQRPCLDISVGSGKLGAVLFDLTPVRFEFLCRVAEGALPSSFSNECFEDLLAFKARLLRKAEQVHRSPGEGLDEDDGELIEDQGGVGLTFIEINQDGHGFLKSISVRITQ